jgi:hypothetical protein
VLLLSLLNSLLCLLQRLLQECRSRRPLLQRWRLCSCRLLKLFIIIVIIFHIFQLPVIHHAFTVCVCISRVPHAKSASLLALAY